MMPFQERKSGGGAFIIAVCGCLVLLAILICFVISTRADTLDHFVFVPFAARDLGVPTGFLPTPSTQMEVTDVVWN